MECFRQIYINVDAITDKEFEGTSEVTASAAQFDDMTSLTRLDLLLPEPFQ